MIRLLSVVVPLGLTVALSAQQAPVFRTGVQLVTIDVVVTDGNDQPVRDLTTDNFEVIDRGRAQMVTDFRFVDIPAVRSELAELRTQSDQG